MNAPFRKMVEYHKVTYLCNVLRVIFNEYVIHGHVIARPDYFAEAI